MAAGGDLEIEVFHAVVNAAGPGKQGIGQTVLGASQIVGLFGATGASIGIAAKQSEAGEGTHG